MQILIDSISFCQVLGNPRIKIFAKSGAHILPTLNIIIKPHQMWIKLAWNYTSV